MAEADDRKALAQVQSFLLTLMEPWDERRDPEEVAQSFLSTLAMAATR